MGPRALCMLVMCSICSAQGQHLFTMALLVQKGCMQPVKLLGIVYVAYSVNSTTMTPCFVGVCSYHLKDVLLFSVMTAVCSQTPSQFSLVGWQIFSKQMHNQPLDLLCTWQHVKFLPSTFQFSQINIFKTGKIHFGRILSTCHQCQRKLSQCKWNQKGTASAGCQGRAVGNDNLCRRQFPAQCGTPKLINIYRTIFSSPDLPSISKLRDQVFSRTPFFPKGPLNHYNFHRLYNFLAAIPEGTTSHLASQYALLPWG